MSRRPVGPFVGTVTILAAALGVLLTLVAVTVAPGDDEARDVAESGTPDAATTRTTSPTASIPPSTEPVAGSGDPGAPAPTGTSIPPGPATPGGPTTPDPAVPPTTADRPPATAAVQVAKALDKLTQRIERRLGESNRDVATRLDLEADGDVLDVVWALDAPKRKAGARADPVGVVTDTASGHARPDQLRRELRRVLRSLADGPLPDSTAAIRLRATFAVDPSAPRTAGDGGDDPRVAAGEAVVLDAVLRVATLDALDSDDVRLDDATLEELLGLADMVRGSDSWGVPLAVVTPDLPLLPGDDGDS